MTPSKLALGVALAAALSVFLWRALDAPADRVGVHAEGGGVVAGVATEPDGGSPHHLAPEAEAANVRVAAVASESGDTADPDARATLDVSVIDELGAAVSDADVSVELTRAEREANGIALDGVTFAWHRPPGMSGVTDASGSARLLVPVGRPLTIVAKEASLHAASGHASSRETIELAALEAGAVSKATLRIRRRPDVEVALRVVDGETGAPVADARVFVELARSRRGRNRGEPLPPPRDVDAVTDAAGQARVVVRSWLDHWCFIFAPGYGPRLQVSHRAEAPSADGAQPIVVALDRSARIEVRVIGAPAGVEVRAGVRQSDFQPRVLVPNAGRPYLGVSRFEFLAATDVRGTHVLDDVPAGAELSLAVHMPLADEALFTAAEPVLTRAGEIHQVTLDLSVSRRFICTVREADGSPVEGQPVQLSAQGPGIVGATDPHRKPLMSARTDGAGVAIFDGVASGPWVVGLSARGARDRTAPERDYAAYSREVEMPASGGDVALDFTLHRGLYIEGRVFAAAGVPSDVFVNAGKADFHAMAQGHEIIDGRFRLGPLLPGLYRVGAMTLGSGDESYAPSAPIEALAGTTGIELELRPGGRLEVRAADPASGASVEAQFTISRVGADGGYRSSFGASESFSATGLELGTYCAHALAPDGRVGILAGIDVRSTEPATATIQLDIGGSLAVHGPESDGIWDVYVSRGEGVLDLHRVTRGEVGRSILPPGTYRVGVVARQKGEVQAAWVDAYDVVHTVDVRVGEETSVTIAP